MRNRGIDLHRYGAFLVALMTILGSSAVSADEDALMQRGRELSQSLATQLQTALISAIQNEGPVAAIQVCKELAPGIAAELSRESGARVGRTSLKVRNPANAPESWQRKVLEDFDRSAVNSGPDNASEYFEPATEGAPARYMKAIPAGAVCLVCHGADIPADVREILDAEYPSDSAVGYQLGDIRGAFSVSWPEN